MRCLHAGLIGLLLLVIIGILIVIWYFEGPDQGGYEQYNEPVIDRGITAFLGAYLPLLLLPSLLFFVLFICYLRSRARKNVDEYDAGKDHNVDSIIDASMTATSRDALPFDAPSDMSQRQPTAPTVVRPTPIHPASSRVSEAPPLPPHHPSSRPIPPLPEFHEARVAPSRSGLPSYDAVVFQQFANSPVPPGAKKPPPVPPQQHLQQQVAPQPVMHQSLHEGSGTATPIFDRNGLKPAHSTTSISRGRVARTPVNKESKESAL